MSLQPESELLENSNLFELTRLSMLFDDSDPIQNHLIALNHIRQTMHQGGLLYAMPKTLERRVNDHYDIKRTLGSPSKAQSSFQQKVILRLGDDTQLDVNIVSSFMGIVRDDSGEEIINAAEERAHAIAHTHCLIPLTEETISYDFQKAECHCNQKELTQLLRHRSLLEQNHALRELLAEQIDSSPSADETQQARVREKIALLDDIEKVLDSRENTTDALITRINTMLEKPQPPFLSLHLQHVREKHHPSNPPNTNTIATIDLQRAKLAKRLTQLVATIKEYQRVIDTETLSTHIDAPIYSATSSDKELCRQKKAVLEAALDYVNGTMTAEKFLETRVEHPRWNESTFGSRAEDIVNDIIDIVEGRTDLLKKLDMAIEKLMVKSKQKPGEQKYIHKLAVLEAAKETLLDNLDDDAKLDEAIRTNPDWNKGLFSKTEELIEEVRQVRAVARLNPSSP